MTPASRAASHIEQGVDRGGVADRLVEDVDDPRQQVDDVGLDLDLVQPDAEVGGHLPGVVRVVGHRLEPLVLGAEGDRVRLDRGSWRCASAVTMLESSPPLRNDATGTSATRCAATESSIDRAEVGRGPAAASAATSAAFQYVARLTEPSRSELRSRSPAAAC